MSIHPWFLINSGDGLTRGLLLSTIKVWIVFPLWSRYLTGKIKEGDAHNITCPGYECTKLVPVEVIETLVSRDMARRYLQFDIKVTTSILYLHLTLKIYGFGKKDFCFSPLKKCFRTLYLVGIDGNVVIQLNSETANKCSTLILVNRKIYSLLKKRWNWYITNSNIGL